MIEAILGDRSRLNDAKDRRAFAGLHDLCVPAPIDSCRLRPIMARPGGHAAKARAAHKPN